MIWFLISQCFALILTLFRLGRTSEADKDLEILILRQQLGILERKQDKPIKPNRAEKLTLAVLAASLKKQTKRPVKQFKQLIRIFQPETVFGWHRQLVKRKWTHEKKNKVGRPPTDEEVKKLVIQLALENNWGYGKIEGELGKLGITLSETAIGNILRAEGIEPAPVRAGSIGWKTLMRHYKAQLLACDFFTIETITLKTLYVFFLIELGTRRVHLAGITQYPDGHWVTQQARNTLWLYEDQESDFVGLIRDNDSKFTDAFDTVFESEDIHVIRTPFRAPNANAFAERMVRTYRQECLDKILVLNQAHLRRVLNEFLDYYNTRRPHQGLDQQSPIERPEPETKGLIQKRKILGGIINDYYRLPAQAPAPQPA
ncbi:MAG: transposase [Chloroflexi bacterium]|nr:transposase [Chloroflexota bacterium]